MGTSIVEKRAQLARALRIVPYLTSEEVSLLVQEAKKEDVGKGTLF